MSSDKIEHTAGTLYKIKFNCDYGKIFFPIGSSLCIIILRIFEMYQSFSKCVMRQNPILIHLVFPYYICLPNDVLCNSAIWVDNTALNSHHVANHQTSNLILKIKVIKKYLFFSPAACWFWSVKISYLILSIQAPTLKAVIQNLFKKDCFEHSNFITEHQWSLTENVL